MKKYKLLKDLPNCELGAIFSKEAIINYENNHSLQGLHSDKYWFEEIEEPVKEDDPTLGKVLTAINELQKIIELSKQVQLFTIDDMVEYSEYRRRKIKSTFLTSEYDIFDKWLKNRKK